MFDIKPKTLYHIYRNHLSNYKPDIERGKWPTGKISICDKETGEVLGEKSIYIAKAENLSKRMPLDNKQIGKDMFSIMTNRDTGKIALMIKSLKTDELEMAVCLLGTRISQIESISCNMSPSYLKFVESTFTGCKIAIDKFHVIKYVLDTLQGKRIQIKNQLLENLHKGKRKTTGDIKILSELELLKRS